jgi:signal transduction histidine kinase
VKDGWLSHLLPEVLERVRRERELRGALAAAQAELLQAERLAAIGEMTVTLHHEINNPLMAASAEVELLLARGDGLSDDQKAALGEVRVALDRIRDIVRKIGNLREAKTTPYSGELKMIDLSE